MQTIGPVLHHVTQNMSIPKERLHITKSNHVLGNAVATKENKWKTHCMGNAPASAP
jgi:hypothetical protein